ncbi:MAG: hypothetical protein FalmKO_06880 [Falsiruegeria mediterranea]
MLPHPSDPDCVGTASGFGPSAALRAALPRLQQVSFTKLATKAF